MGFLDKIFGGKKKKKGALIGGLLTGGIGGAFAGAKIGGDLRGPKSPNIKGRFEREDPRLAELLNKSQSGKLRSIGFLNKQIDKSKAYDPTNEARSQTQYALGAAERNLTGAREDQLRQVNESVARRGLGNSSIGIGSVMGINRNAANTLAAARAGIQSGESRLKQNLADQNFNRLQSATSGLTSITSGLPTRNYMQGAKGVRGPGILDALAPIAGAGIGAYLGGPAGAQVGMKAGSGISQAFRG